MPRTKTNPRHASNNEYKKLQVMILGYMEIEEKPYAVLSKRLGLSENTFRKYMKNPELMTLGTLKKIRQNLHVDNIQEWREAAIR